jgi:nucleoside-diphosphate-sugar epimerase
VRIAVTGAGGQVGSWLLRHLPLLQPGLQIVAVCRNTFVAKKLSHAGCAVRVGSLLEPREARAMLTDCDSVVHCALSWENLTRRDSVNLAMIRALQRARVGRILFMSTVATYSSCIQSGINTYFEPCPDNDYGRDKVMCERAVLGNGEDRESFVLRLGHVYGPHLGWSRRILALALYTRFRLPFDGRLSSNAIRIDRISQALIRLLRGDVEPGVFNLTDDPATTWRQVFDWHTRTCGLPPVAALGEAESEALREHFIGLKRVTIAKAVRQISAAAGRVLESLAESSPILKSAGRSILRWSPERLELSLRRRHQALAASHELDAGGEKNVWEPALSILFSDTAPGNYLKYAQHIARDSCAESNLEETMSAWYRGWAFPDGLWRI